MNIAQSKKEVKPTLEKVIAGFKKANKLRKTQILKKYGVNSIEKLSNLLDTSKKDKKVTMTELASLVLNATETTMEISFQKQISDLDIYNEVMNFYNNSTPVDFSKNLKEVIKKSSKGQERIATISHNSKTDKFGRLYATELTVEKDLEANSDNRMILISLNHLNWALINGVKYTVK